MPGDRAGATADGTCNATLRTFTRLVCASAYKVGSYQPSPVSELTTALNAITHSKMAAPELPQEIINKIIDEHAEDTKSLRSCSLVVTRWNDRSRHHLFANLNITQDSLPQLQSLKQIKDHVRSLCLIQDEEIWITWRNLEEISNFFPRAESLTLRSTQKLTLLEVCQPAGFSNHFSRNLSSLTIEGSMSSDSFCLFIRLFPRLDNLELYGLCTTWKTLESSQISAIQKPTFRGTLTLYNLGCQYHPVTRPIVDHLLPMTFKDLRLDCCWFDTPESLEALLSKCQDTLKAIEVSSIQFIRESRLHSPFTGGLVSL